MKTLDSKQRQIVKGRIANGYRGDVEDLVFGLLRGEAPPAEADEKWVCAIHKATGLPCGAGDVRGGEGDIEGVRANAVLAGFRPDDIEVRLLSDEEHAGLMYRPAREQVLAEMRRRVDAAFPAGLAALDDRRLTLIEDERERELTDEEKAERLQLRAARDWITRQMPERAEELARVVDRNYRADGKWPEPPSSRR